MWYPRPKSRASSRCSTRGKLPPLGSGSLSEAGSEIGSRPATSPGPAAQLIWAPNACIDLLEDRPPLEPIGGEVDALRRQLVSRANRGRLTTQAVDEALARSLRDVRSAVVSSSKEFLPSDGGGSSPRPSPASEPLLDLGLQQSFQEVLGLRQEAKVVADRVPHLVERVETAGMERAFELARAAALRREMAEREQDKLRTNQKAQLRRHRARYQKLLVEAKILREAQHRTETEMSGVNEENEELEGEIALRTEDSSQGQARFARYTYKMDVLRQRVNSKVEELESEIEQLLASARQIELRRLEQSEQILESWECTQEDEARQRRERRAELIPELEALRKEESDAVRKSDEVEAKIDQTREDLDAARQERSSMDVLISGNKWQQKAHQKRLEKDLREQEMRLAQAKYQVQLVVLNELKKWRQRGSAEKIHLVQSVCAKEAEEAALAKNEKELRAGIAKVKAELEALLARNKEKVSLLRPLEVEVNRLVARGHLPWLNQSARLSVLRKAFKSREGMFNSTIKPLEDELERLGSQQAAVKEDIARLKSIDDDSSLIIKNELEPERERLRQEETELAEALQTLVQKTSLHASLRLTESTVLKVDQLAAQRELAWDVMETKAKLEKLLRM